jgi:hypothetical protein
MEKVTVSGLNKLRNKTKSMILANVLASSYRDIRTNNQSVERKTKLK